MPRSKLAVLVVLAFLAARCRGQINTVQRIAPDVYFHQGDPRTGTCNNGWIVMADCVVVVDANYPVGAKVVLPKIHALTPKPVRYVIDTHVHPDHSFGNRIWADDGAAVIAHENVVEELRSGGAAAWELSATTRPDVRASSLRLPELTYARQLSLDDAGHRVELHWPGIAHTRGDTLVWLPNERILFTGDICVNGAYNYIHDSYVGEWIKVLEWARSLGADKVCPGHGPLGGAEILADQQGYFIELRRGVQAMIDSGKTLDQAKAAGPLLAAEMKTIGHIARYVPSDVYFAAHIERMYGELR